ncbi:Sterol O-acyltransferase 2 (Sterol-ester synthase 2) [Coemansia biformis]|uniref:O-acyltransferase n=1 Tax=Coemansia biformis TaxID=1286918 RepID=A0A9W7YG51_9FUNG|nr:Sterol O-acyltransferase 2 (Sterol-ester synthase 2) [Coemansia biformis]
MFQPRASILDYTHLMYQGSDRIRGLVTCFWAVVGAYLVSLLVSHYEHSGEILSRDLADLIFSRGKDLVLSDLALVLSTAFVVPFVRVLWIGRWQPRLLDPRQQLAVTLQVAVEVGWLAAWYLWQGTRGWPWSQRCFFALHTAVNWMKIHSYLSTNRHLASSLRARDELEQRRDLGSEETRELIRCLDAKLCRQTARFPATQTLANYAMFQLCPTLVYELEYPRTSHIRWGYVAEKMAGTAGIFCVFYVVVAHLMIPRLEKMPEDGIVLTAIHLMGPMATCWLLFFFITFDSIANGFAELTMFADRRFYDDWWNARGLDEFSRKWNRPVHMFLARHVYIPVRELWKAGSTGSSPALGGSCRTMLKTVPASVVAMAATFFFSSVLHEITLVVACHRWNHGVFFFSQMLQIPMIVFVDRIPWFKDQHALRNWSFWLAMVTFQPLLLCLYTHNAFVARAQDAASAR